jgi:hypothetical protein
MTPWDEDGAFVDGRSHRFRDRSLRDRIDVDEGGLDAEPVSRLVERRVGRRRQDHPRRCDLGPSVAGSEHREQDRLRASRGDDSGESGRRVDEPASDADEVVLHGEQRGERSGVEAVGRGERRERFTADRVGRGQTRVVDVGESVSAVGGQVPGAHGLELRADLVRTKTHERPFGRTGFEVIAGGTWVPPSPRIGGGWGWGWRGSW